jgi:hypothetical protein
LSGDIWRLDCSERRCVSGGDFANIIFELITCMGTIVEIN